MPEPVPPAAAPAAVRPPPRTLVPREHGAWGQLALPLVSALVIGRPRASALLLTAATVLAFLAHESLIVILGQRGRRAATEETPRARRLLASLGGLASLAGLAGAALAPPLALGALALAAALAAVVAWLAVQKLEKTLPGEFLVGAALSAGGFAVALAGRAPFAWALASFVTWTLSFAVATLAVQAVLARARSKGARDPGRAHAAAAAGVLAGAFALSVAGAVAHAAPIALVPGTLLSIAVCLGRVPPRRLREVGWAMAGSSAIALVLLVVTLR